MRRKIQEDLLRWRRETENRLPLLLYGARQVGKTYVMKELGRDEFQNMVYVNFEEDSQIGSYFETEIRAEAVVAVLERYFHVKSEYENYCIVGGMPAAVLADISVNPTIEQYEIRQMIFNSYVADMAKYADPAETVKIFEAYDSLPSQLAKENKKFQYKLIRSGARASQYGISIDWLIRAGIVNKCS